MKKEKKLVIYQASNGAIELKGDSENETIWASLDQIASVFGRDKSVISRHIKNIFKEQELQENSVVAFFATTATDGKSYKVTYYNLDLIISVGYRVNSKNATKFRQWATQTIRKHITDGFTINSSRIEKNYQSFFQAVEDVKKLANNNLEIKTDDILELIKLFASTWFSLDSFDKGEMFGASQSKQTIELNAQKFYADLEILKNDLIKKGEATDFFAQEKQKGSFEGILGNVFQTAFGEEVYPTIEQKAAHLLYFTVKNHPFNDGNKRSGAFAFIWFLQKAGVDFRKKITPEALTAITLLVATSDPQDKERITDLVILLLTGK